MGVTQLLIRSDTNIGNNQAGGEPVGYLQAWPRRRTRDYREQVQQAVRVRIEIAAARLQFQHPNCSSTQPPASLSSQRKISFSKILRNK